MEKAQGETVLDTENTAAQLFTFIFTKQTLWPGSVWKSVSCLLIFAVIGTGL